MQCSKNAGLGSGVDFIPTSSPRTAYLRWVSRHKRVAAILASGKQAWVYIDARFAPEFESSTIKKLRCAVQRNERKSVATLTWYQVSPINETAREKCVGVLVSLLTGYAWVSISGNNVTGVESRIQRNPFTPFFHS